MAQLTIAFAIFLAVLKRSFAQNATYPVWVTNDYDCVIGCIQDQLGSASPPATQDQTDAALGCVRDTCSQSTAAGNIYQAHYIINMFNTIGSIYEPQSWQDGNAPNATDLSGPSGWEEVATTTTWTQDGSPTTVTTSVWVPASTDTSTDTSTDSATDGTDSSTAASTTSTASTITTSHSSSKTSSASASSSAKNATVSNGTADSSAARIVGVGVGVQVLVATVVILGCTAAGALGVVL